VRKKIRFSREALEAELRDMKNWPTVDPTLLSEQDARTFERRKNAIRDYLAGTRIAVVQETHGVSYSQLSNFLSRCLKTHPDGRIWGERALIPRIRCKTYERREPTCAQTAGTHGGHSGALTQLFERFPDIRDYVIKLFSKCKRGKTVHEARIPHKSIHKRFLDKCREHGITKDYPFNTKWLGRGALRTFLKKLLDQGHDATVKARYGKDAARKLASRNKSNDQDVTRPFQRVQFDGHRIDAFFTFLVHHPYGGVEELVLPRIWLMVIVDVFSRAIVGYKLVLSKEYSAADVMRCVRQAIVPWKHKTLTIPGLRYPEHGGLPSILPDYQWAIWREFIYDNAKANLAVAVRRFLTTVIVGGEVSCGPIEEPGRRAIIERLFRTLEENGIHRLPSTTGSNPKDTRREEPEDNALRYQIRLDHFEQLIDVMIAQYNTTPHAGIGFRTPLEVLEYHAASGGTINHLPEDRRNETALLFEKVVRTVRGNSAQGRRPYIEFEGVRYQNEVLDRSPHLIGKKLFLYVDADDLRCLQARLENGADFGVLTAHGFWGRTPHTLVMRRTIMRLRQKKLISYVEGDDPIHVYHDYLASQAATKKRVRADYVNTSRMMARSRKPDPAKAARKRPSTPQKLVARRKTMIL